IGHATVGTSNSSAAASATAAGCCNCHRKDRPTEKEKATADHRYPAARTSPAQKPLRRHPQQVTPSAFCRCTKASGRADCLTSSMPKFEVHIPAADAQSLHVTFRVDADHWMAALKTGLHKLGAQGSSVQNVLVDIQDDNSVHITEAQSGRVF